MEIAGASIGAVVGGLGSRWVRPILTPMTGGNDNFLDFGYLILGGMLVWVGVKGKTNAAAIGMGAGIISQAVVDIGQNMGIVQGVEKVLAGMAGVTLVAGPGKTYFLTPQQTQAYMARRRQMGARGGPGNRVMAAPQRRPVTLVGAMKPAWKLADCM
jgi:hypothetical protein